MAAATLACGDAFRGGPAARDLLRWVGAEGRCGRPVVPGQQRSSALAQWSRLSWMLQGACCALPNTDPASTKHVSKAQLPFILRFSEYLWCGHGAVFRLPGSDPRVERREDKEGQECCRHEPADDNGRKRPLDFSP